VAQGAGSCGIEIEEAHFRHWPIKAAMATADKTEVASNMTGRVHKAMR
jgi:hypothetical protein